MSKKTKLIATIMAMCLVITLGVIGIFAVKTLNMSVGGNITFTADGLEFEVSAGEFKTESGAEYTDITSQSGKMQAFAIDTNTKQSEIQDKIDSWTNLDLYLNSKGDAVLHFSVTNKMTTQLYVYISTQLGENINNNMDLYVSQNIVEIGVGDTTNFEITFDILDMNINAGLNGFNIAVNFAKESLVQTQNKIDQATGAPTTEVDYYYVEMGTYNGKPVRWRYVADPSGTRYDGVSAVTSLSGYYVLETQIPVEKAFLLKRKYDAQTYKHIEEGYTNINANDYGLSDIRNYLTTTESGGFLDLINISSSDITYSLICGRSLTDLYSGISSKGTDITSENTSFCLSLLGDKSIASQKDKLWLMSYKEVMTFFEDTNDARAWGSKYYWLRSPGPTEGNLVYYIHTNGSVSNGFGLTEYENTPRPCFKIA